MDNYITTLINRERASLLKEEIRINESIIEAPDKESLDALYHVKYILDDLDNLQNIYSEFLNPNK